MRPVGGHSCDCSDVFNFHPIDRILQAFVLRHPVLAPFYSRTRTHKLRFRYTSPAGMYIDNLYIHIIGEPVHELCNVDGRRRLDLAVVTSTCP